MSSPRAFTIKARSGQNPCSSRLRQLIGNSRLIEDFGRILEDLGGGGGGGGRGLWGGFDNRFSGKRFSSVIPSSPRRNLSELVKLSHGCSLQLLQWYLFRKRQQHWVSRLMVNLPARLSARLMTSQERWVLIRAVGGGGFWRDS